MPPRDPDLDALADQLGDRLGRIDRELEQLFEGAVDPDAAAAALEEHAGEVHDLIDSVLSAAQTGEDHADLDRIVAHCVETTIRDSAAPLVVRKRLAGNLPPVNCSPAELMHAVQRALALAAEHAGNGGEIAIATRANGADVGLRIDAECLGAAAQHLRERALTLQAFVANRHGRCRLDLGADDRLTLAIELPSALEPERRTTPPPTGG